MAGVHRGFVLPAWAKGSVVGNGCGQQAAVGAWVGGSSSQPLRLGHVVLRVLCLLGI